MKWRFKSRAEFYLPCSVPTAAQRSQSQRIVPTAARRFDRGVALQPRRSVSTAAQRFNGGRSSTRCAGI